MRAARDGRLRATSWRLGAGGASCAGIPLWSARYTAGRCRRLATRSGDRAVWDALRQDIALRRAHAAASAGVHRRRHRSRSRSASARTPRSSASWTPCCGGRCRTRDADGSCRWPKQRPREGRVIRHRSRPPTSSTGVATRQSFAAMAAYTGTARKPDGDAASPNALRTLTVSPAFLDVLGAARRRSAGTSQLSEEIDGRHRVVLLTDALWRRRFGARSRRSSAAR